MDILKFVTDGETLVNAWLMDNKYGFKTMKNTTIYLSLANYLHAQVYYAELLKVMAIQGEEALSSFKKDHAMLENFLFSGTVDKYLKTFTSSDKILSDKLVLKKDKNFSIVLFKGLDIECEAVPELSPIIAEPLGLISWYKQNNKDIKLVTDMEELISFVKEFKVDVDMDVLNLN